jgi:hypothetical protein
MSPFSEEARSYADTRKRTGAEYLRFTPDYRTVARILNPNARTVWKHFIAQANGGRGMGAVCPDSPGNPKICPVELKYADLPKDNDDRKANYARKKFVVNVLDRTPYTTCKNCNTVTPGKVSAAASTKQCVSCGASLKGHDFHPLNKVKILESGPRLFNQNLNAIQQMQFDELGKDIVDYDLTFTTQGIGRERNITVIPQDPKPLEEDAFTDAETGEEQQLFDLELLAEPASVEEITLMLQGATVEQLNVLRGIE